MEYKEFTFTLPTGEQYELLSMQQFKDRIGLPTLPTPTLSYKMAIDELDWVRLGTFRYIVYNDKAKAMTVAERRPSKLVANSRKPPQ